MSDPRARRTRTGRFRSRELVRSAEAAVSAVRSYRAKWKGIAAVDVGHSAPEKFPPKWEIGAGQSIRTCMARAKLNKINKFAHTGSGLFLGCFATRECGRLVKVSLLSATSLVSA